MPDQHRRAFRNVILPKDRLRAIGWTKAYVISEGINNRNASGRLKLAEENTARELKLLVHGEKPARNAHCVLNGITSRQYNHFEHAVLNNGGTRVGHGLINKEQAIIKIIKSVNPID